MTNFRGHSGFMLVTVLIITAIGLLFGAGALLMFRYQCQMRIDRQHELEKVYAVRSTLSYIRTFANDILDEGRAFTYHTGSERNLGLFVKPVVPVFPDPHDPGHFAMRQGKFTMNQVNQYCFLHDYEYGAMGVDDLESRNAIKGFYGALPGLLFDDAAATNSVRWWVNIGMRGTGGWLQEDYGRRYFFRPNTWVDGETRKDVMRLCIIRNVTNEQNEAGSRHGWPLSKAGERALVLEISPTAGNVTSNNAEIALWGYEHTGAAIVHTLFDRWYNRPSYSYMGIQLADDKICAFYIPNEGSEESELKHGYIFLPVRQLDREIYRYFSSEVIIDGKAYCGIRTNDYGKVEAPELRAVLEVEAASDSRKPGQSLASEQVDFLQDFRVTPAYQYDVFLEHPAGITNRATIAQKVGEYAREDEGKGYSIITYDTHGTEHKGFRTDEREHARRAGE